jgi:hypothetical protein
MAKGMHNIKCSAEIQSCHIRKGHNAMGTKPIEQVPMCYAHHHYQHSIGEPKFWGDLIDDAKQAALDLWINTGNTKYAIELIYQWLTNTPAVVPHK